ncbi:MAG: hypothetical protein IJ159_04145 [Prevotella sp.]|nr:hypothetical protein [Prevotella sp.]
MNKRFVFAILIAFLVISCSNNDSSDSDIVDYIDVYYSIEPLEEFLKLADIDFRYFEDKGTVRTINLQSIGAKSVRGSQTITHLPALIGYRLAIISKPVTEDLALDNVNCTATMKPTIVYKNGSCEELAPIVSNIVAKKIDGKWQIITPSENKTTDVLIRIDEFGNKEFIHDYVW